MFVVAAIFSILMAAVLAGSGRGKLVRQEAVVQSLTKVGVTDDRMVPLAAIEFAGAAGLVIGLFWAPLGILAAIGVVLYFGGAVAAHARVRDFGGITPATVLLVVAIVTLILRIASA